MTSGTPRTVRRTSVLAAPADVVWRALAAPATLVHVAAPLLRMPDLEQRRDPWRPGESVTTRLRLLGVIPLYRHTVVIESLDAGSRTASTSEHGGPVTVWRHRISVEAVDSVSCRYTDEIEMDAGRLSRVVDVLARGFYRWRHARWRRLAPVLAAAARAPTD